MGNAGAMLLTVFWPVNLTENGTRADAWLTLCQNGTELRARMKDRIQLYGNSPATPP